MKSAIALAGVTLPTLMGGSADAFQRLPLGAPKAQSVQSSYDAYCTSGKSELDRRDAVPPQSLFENWWDRRNRVLRDARFAGSSA